METCNIYESDYIKSSTYQRQIFNDFYFSTLVSIETVPFETKERTNGFSTQ